MHSRSEQDPATVDKLALKEDRPQIHPLACQLAQSAIPRTTDYRSFLGGISLASQTIPPIPISIAWPLCRLSVVCHIRAPCSNRSTDLDAIWQVHVWALIIIIIIIIIYYYANGSTHIKYT